MKKITFAVLLLVVALLIAGPLPGHARGYGGFRGGGHIVVRGGYGWGWWPWAIGGALVGSTLAAPHYYPPPVVVQAPPPLYVQPEQQQHYYWYYCQNPQGYYPYVKSCPSGWMKVVPDANPSNPEEGMAK
jgi:hypothetical protein